MKNTILTRLYLIILFASVSGMAAFTLGAYATNEAFRFNCLLFIAFCEVLIILSIVLLFATKSNKN